MCVARIAWGRCFLLENVSILHGYVVIVKKYDKELRNKSQIYKFRISLSSAAKQMIAKFGKHYVEFLVEL